nr:glycosyltransferase [Paenibacillus forsythiae]
MTPVYNGERYLSSYFQSWENQTYQNYRIILVDDGSNDNSVNIIEERVKGDSRIHLITQQHGGISSAISRGLQEASSNYIVLMDQDDISASNRLEKTVELFTQGYELIMSAYEIIDAHGTTSSKIIHIPNYINSGNILLESLKRNYFLGTSMAFHYRHDFTFNFLSGGTTDYDIALKMLFKGYRFGYIPEVLLYYRVHNNNTSANYKTIKKDALQVLRIYNFEELEHCLKQQDYKEYQITLTLGIMAQFLGDWQTSFSYLKRCESHLDLDDELSKQELHFYFSVYFYQTSDYLNCQKYLEKVMSLNAAAANNMGVLEALNRHFDISEKWFRKALQINSDYLDAKRNLIYLKTIDKEAPEPKCFYFTNRLLRSTLLHTRYINGI